MKKEFIKPEVKTVSSKRNLDNPIVKSEVIEFGKTLEKLEKEMCPRSMNYYGYPLNQEDFQGCVLNGLLGGVHWSVVKYAEENNIIRKHGEYWSIIAKEDGWDDTRKMMMRSWPRYARLTEDLELLKEMKRRIEYGKSLGVQQAIGE